ncbi:hypothetical protein WJX72_010088 [[Myrmecia] bisecta]|uniref:RBR-type E3 ubiquitin transferase n=1 Tax=[Myrmecia] bisecta TaxID=41462 RepID=A0AAW1PAT2_9CHLO
MQALWQLVGAFADLVFGPRTVVCGICLEEVKSICGVAGCGHQFCNSCLGQHISTRIQSKRVPIRCPEHECATLIDGRECRKLLQSSGASANLLEELLQLEIEASIPEEQRIYCPNPRCALLLVRDDQGTAARQNVRSRCPACQQLMCASCRAAWHTGLTCEEFRRRPSPEERAFLALVHSSRWKACPKCKRVIQRSAGCNHMTCKCGTHFCYRCGAAYPVISGYPQPACKCGLYNHSPLDTSPDDTEARQLQLPEALEAPHMVGLAAIRVPHDQQRDRGAEVEGPEHGHHPHHPRYRTALCRYYSNGFCRYGTTCNFAHGVDQLRARHQWRM